MALRSEPALARLRSVLWFLAAVGVAFFATVLTRDFLHSASKNALLAGQVAWLACTGSLWWRTKSALQHVAAFAGVVALAETVADRIDPHVGLFGYGLALWLVAAVWAVATWRRYPYPKWRACCWRAPACWPEPRSRWRQRLPGGFSPCSPWPACSSSG